VLAPLVLLGGLEAALRLAGYGYSTHFFQRLRIGNEDFFVNNDKVGLRFFPPELVRSPLALRMKAHKAAGNYRIFILGESAAMGDPEAAYGAWRYLEALLDERFPGQTFEIINVSMTAINSHAILPIARECARHEGDLWIVYMGNNEMVGPFGAATVFGAQSPPLGFIRLSLALQTTRVGQLLTTLGRKLKGKSADYPAWAGMQMFAGNRVGPDDHRRAVVYENFHRNLEDILRAGLHSGARIVLNTVAVNLKDCPPFASLVNSNLPSAQRTAFESLFAEASRVEAQGNFADAARNYAQAAETDSRCADVQFHWAECLAHTLNQAQAREHYQLACDLDALPFRADSGINGLISQAGHQFAGPDLRLLDAAAVLAASSPAGVSGQESFYEHVHFNFDGNYALARAWAEQVEQFLPSSMTNHASTLWASQAVCERRLGLSDWNRCSVLREVVRRVQQPPLSEQSNNARRLAGLHDWENQLRLRMDAAEVSLARSDFQKALAVAPDDYYLYENFADFLQSVNDSKESLNEWKKVLELIPHNFLPWFEIGRLLGREGNDAEAQSYLQRAVTLRPDFSEGWLELGMLHISRGKFDVALEEFDRARRLKPTDARIYYETGRVLAKMNRRSEAEENYRRAIQLQPDYWEAHAELGGHLGLDGKIAEAKSEFEEVIRLRPDFAMGHLNLGVALLKQGLSEAARRQFKEALRLDPGNKLARDYLGQVQAMRGR